MDLPPGSRFGVASLPYGVFSAGDRNPEAPRVGVRIGDSVLDLVSVLGEEVRHLNGQDA